MKVTLLGTGTLVPSAHRASPGLVVEAGTEKILVDPGPGSLRRLAEVGINYLDLDAVGITHRHPDHTIDLLHLFFATRYPFEGKRTKPLTVFGPPGLTEFLESFTRAHAEWMGAEGYARPVIEIPPGRALDRPGYRIATEEMQHLKTSIGYRFEENGAGGARGGAVLAYTGDTELCKGAVNLAHDADLLLIECSSHKPWPLHLTPVAVASIVRDSGARHVVLVHIYPDPDEESLARAVRAACDAEVRLGVDGETIEVKARGGSSGPS